MKTWLDDEWQSGDATIDGEHRKLHQMIASMAAVIVNDPGLGLGAEAVSVLHERMRIHFRMEEQLAARLGAEIVLRLKEEHRKLLGMLTRISEAIRDADHALASQRVTSFREELDIHDREVDIPIFRKQSA
jgi:hemerythrin-like metal-binding protein